MNEEKKKKRSSNILLILAVLCFLGAGGFMLYNKWESDKAGKAADAALTDVKSEIAAAISAGSLTMPAGESAPEGSGAAAPDKASAAVPATDEAGETIPPEEQDWSAWPAYGEAMPTVEANGIRFIGILEIPDLGLELPVIEEFSYALLEISACLFDGSVINDDMMIAGHNFDSHFKDIKNLQPGAKVYFTDAAGRRWEFEMTGQEAMHRSQNLVMYGGEWDLTLFTCVPNTTNRLGVRFKRVYPGYETRHVDKTLKYGAGPEVP